MDRGDPAFGRIFGFPSFDPFGIDQRPIAALIAEWQWLDPLAAILRFGGFSIDQVASEARVAAEVRTLWEVYRASEREAKRRYEEYRIEEEMQWRKEGLPVPCPLCFRLEPCACRFRRSRPTRQEAISLAGPG